jgi:hypothetical protein
MFFINSYLQRQKENTYLSEDKQKLNDNFEAA